MEEIKQVPYGVSDFVTVRERNLYYVDKTMYLSLLEQQPDMVVSGINLGANLGDDVLYSGTVAAALEWRFLGLPAFAFSLISRQPESPRRKFIKPYTRKPDPIARNSTTSTMRRPTFFSES